MVKRSGDPCVRCNERPGMFRPTIQNPDGTRKWLCDECAGIVRPRVGTVMRFTSGDTRSGSTLWKYDGIVVVRHIVEDFVGKGIWAVQVEGHDPANPVSDRMTWVAWMHELTALPVASERERDE